MDLTHTNCFYKIIKYLLLYSFHFFLLNSYVFSQSNLNPRPIKKIINEWNEINSQKLYSKPKPPLKFIYINNNFYNTNHVNLENLNGIYIPKGYGTISSFFAEYSNKYITLSLEPSIVRRVNYFKMDLPEKNGLFSVLNDVPLNEVYQSKIDNLRNAGIKFAYDGTTIGYGNWDQWWGYGIHNSLAFSNNSRGIYSYFAETSGSFNNIFYEFKYKISDILTNYLDSEYFLSSYYIKIGFKFIEIAKSRIIQNGGYDDLPWSIKDAVFVPITNKNIQYWDEIINYHILLNFKASGLKVFIELGSPTSTIVQNNKSDGMRNNVIEGSNIGFRKYGLFNNKNLILGFEYSRLVQGHYFNVLPTPNWYQNIRYNYSAHNGRRWGAHSGSDSDDFLLFYGYVNKKYSFIIGHNYERHGVTYNFPPEVKLESRIKAGYNHRNLSVYLNYENEYFQHYGFVDKNINVWVEEFEPGSIQRTNTILITIEYKFPI